MKNQLPLLYRWLRAHGLNGLTPWHFLDPAEDRGRIESLREECALEVGGARDILPFAARQDMDTIAGFLVEDGSLRDTVITVHLTWAGKKELLGWPSEGTTPSFQKWITEVLVEDAVDWMSEGDLRDILEE